MDGNRMRRLLLFASLAVTLLVAVALLVRGWRPSGPAHASTLHAGANSNAAVYLDQAGSILADAQMNLDNVQFYLPAASPNDPDDPTWETVQESADAVTQDADLLDTLSPPPELASANDALVESLQSAGNAAEAAASDLSAGKTAAGQEEMAHLTGAIDRFQQARSALPDATPVPSFVPVVPGT